ncbi:MAG: hypothetical protein HYR94_13670 [Chloroflexi bacterium]|nr:hypothetical protein [Chloroflexota bacterium]
MKYRKDLLIAGCYILLTLILTYPVAFGLATEIAGFKGEDNLQWRWFLWWFKHALLTLHTSITDVTLLYAPTGGEQPLYAVTVFIPALALPLTLLAGPTASFNLSFLLSFALSGYTAYLLAYYLTRHRLAAFIAGLIFAFYPARFGYATGTFLGQLTTYFLPLYVLTLFMLAHRSNRAIRIGEYPTGYRSANQQAIERPRLPLHASRFTPPRLLRRAIWAALVLACLCLTWPLHVVYGVVVFTTVFLGFQTVSWLRRPDTRSSIKYFAVTFGLALALIIGPYSSLLNSVLRGENAHLGSTDTTYFALDLLAFISPNICYFGSSLPWAQ